MRLNGSTWSSKVGDSFFTSRISVTNYLVTTEISSLCRRNLKLLLKQLISEFLVISVKVFKKVLLPSSLTFITSPALLPEWHKLVMWELVPASRNYIKFLILRQRLHFLFSHILHIYRFLNCFNLCVACWNHQLLWCCFIITVLFLLIYFNHYWLIPYL